MRSTKSLYCTAANISNAKEELISLILYSAACSFRLRYVTEKFVALPKTRFPGADNSIPIRNAAKEAPVTFTRALISE